MIAPDTPRPPREGHVQRLLEICRMQSRLVSADFDLEQFMQMSVDMLRSALGLGGVAVELVEGEDIVYRAVDAEHSRFKGLRVRRDGSLSGLALQEQTLIYCIDTHEDPRVDRAACKAANIRSMVCAPLYLRERAVGVLKAFSSAPDAFDPQDIEAVAVVGETLGAALVRQIEHAEREALLAELSCARDEAEARATRADMAEKMGGLGHWRYDYGTQRSVWSDQMYDLHGLSRGVGIEAEAVMAMVHPGDSALVRGLLDPAAASRQTGRFANFRLLRADGEERRMEALTAVETSAHGEVTAIMGVLRDVTGRHEHEVQLRRAREAAEAAADTKARFLANMTHELRTPLTAILGFSRLIERRQDLATDVRIQVHRVLQAGEALMHTINDILDFSKLEDGCVEIRPQALQIGASLAQCLEFLRPQADEKQLRLALRVDPEVPEVVILDPARVRQLVLNLAGNAVKFTSSGGVDVVLRLAESRTHLVFEVIDTGPGISPEAHSRLFRRFSQIDGAMDGGLKGSGLGLAICKGLVEAMQGEIGVESAPGRGSRFWFSLPLHQPDDATLSPQPELSTLGGCRLLVVDDNATNRLLLRSILQAWGAEVDEASGGTEAVAKAQAHAYDLILMDLRMPGLDGVATARLIRGAQGSEDALILACSADDMSDLDDALFCGGVAKPIDPEALSLALAAALRATKPSASAQRLPA
jgi:PAS domain S-box-containing protein